MKIMRITSTAILSLVVGITASVYAQPYSQQGEHEKQDRQEENKRDQAKPEKQHGEEQGQGDHKQQPSPAKQQPAKPQRQTQKAQPQNEPDRNKQQGQAGRQERSSQSQPQPQRAEQGRPQDQNRRQEHDQAHVASQPSHQQRQRTPEQQRVQQAAWQQHRSESWASDHHTWQQRGGYNGYRIPDARYSGYFGPEHGFRIYGRPFLVVGGFPRFHYRGYWFSLVDPWPQYWSNNWYDTDEVYVSYVDNGYYLFDRSHPEAGIAIRISL